eukprot:TRINITY_DN19052_c0_g1_i1.p1 TRINITY_DN19052_c0_g1~~TRINITY_DN19052_c0_g1_i1.p1  ORF type:complete len:550 (-),score=88.96 TRINITY_DN19052_c0_g1_i1:579-2228(-)
MLVPLDTSYFSVESIQSAFHVVFAFSLLRTLPQLTEFYRWFYESNLEISKHRGYGQTACRMYGMLPSPSLTPLQHRIAGTLLIASCLGSAVAVEKAWAECILLPICFLLYHLYFSQLYCEAHVGAHVTVMIPPALVLLFCYNLGRLELERNCGSLPAACENVDGLSAFGQVYFVFLMKVIITFSYSCAGASKLRTSMLEQRSWCDGSTLQACIIEALCLSDHQRHEEQKDSKSCLDRLDVPHFTFGLPTPFSNKVQKFFLTRIGFLQASSFFSVGLEFLAPLILLVNSMPFGEASAAQAFYTNTAFGILGLSFHYGIAYFQNVDFVSWWAPAYAFIFLDPVVALNAAEHLGGSFPRAVGLTPLATFLATTYVILHISVGMYLTCGFANVEMIPFSGFRMFCDNKDLFHPYYRKHIWLSDKPHMTGTLKNYCFPLLGRPQTVLESELGQLDFKYFLVGHNGTVKDKSSKALRDLSSLEAALLATSEVPIQETRIVTNIKMSPEMQSCIDELERLGRLGAGEFRNNDNIATLLTLIDRMRQEFHRAEKRVA